MTATPAPLRYRLTPTDLSGHRCTVSLTLADPDPAGQVLSLPNWIPGSYLLREFARQIETLQAESNGVPVALHKQDPRTWQADPVDGPLTLTWTVYAWDLSVRAAHLDDTHGFFNGTSVFLRPHGRDDRVCLLELCPPPAGSTVGDMPWQVYTSLPEATGEPGAAQRHGFGLYRAPDYDALIDHPIEMGTPQVISFTAHGAEHELVFTGVVPGLDLARLAADVQRICETQIAFFEPETQRAPFLDSAERYVFLTQVTGDGYGGLEHRASTALLTSRNSLPVLGQTQQSDSYREFLGLVSHEYFHTWHVKRIKPAVFAPYALDREGLTRLLWVFEGFTSYYDDLMLWRAGVITEKDYLACIARTVNGVLRGPGRFKQSIAESSFDAWTRYYRQDENSPNAIVSYYTKGALAALGLDLTLRQATQRRHSLDDVMRHLWQAYGRDFYQGKGQGLPETALPDQIEVATGVNVRDFLACYVDGCLDVPLAELLAGEGYALRAKPTPEPRPSLDVRTRARGQELELATVYEGGAAHRGGLSAGDVLVAIDGLRVPANGLDALLSRYQPGATVDVHVFRRDELRHYRVTLAVPATEWVIEAQPA